MMAGAISMDDIASQLNQSLLKAMKDGLNFVIYFGTYKLNMGSVFSNVFED